AAFQADIQQLGIADKIMTVTFSEFGRQVRENGSTGTDHGDLAPFFVVGNAAAAGILGDHPVFTNQTSFYYNQNQRRYDYRQIFASLLKDWLGASTSLMITSELDYYVTGNQKVDVIKNSQKANAVCSTLGTSNVVLDKGIKIYPVPASQFVYVEFDNRTSGSIKYQLMDMSGRVIQSSSEKPISNRIEIHVSGIPEGNYLLKINTDSEEISRKIIVSHR
ncbi:MAG: T9SS type A sorting domain-containing protein, partial [Chryseobacterium gambrini]|nr:T9SS type A sorting domain-containing protein [Chryseobacterium gambrini]